MKAYEQFFDNIKKGGKEALKSVLRRFLRHEGTTTLDSLGPGKGLLTDQLNRSLAKRFGDGVHADLQRLELRNSGDGSRLTLSGTVINTDSPGEDKTLFCAPDLCIRSLCISRRGGVLRVSLDADAALSLEEMEDLLRFLNL